MLIKILSHLKNRQNLYIPASIFLVASTWLIILLTNPVNTAPARAARIMPRKSLQFPQNAVSSPEGLRSNIASNKNLSLNEESDLLIGVFMVRHENQPADIPLKRRKELYEMFAGIGSDPKNPAQCKPDGVSICSVMHETTRYNGKQFFRFFADVYGNPETVNKPDAKDDYLVINVPPVAGRPNFDYNNSNSWIINKDRVWEAITKKYPSLAKELTDSYNIVAFVPPISLGSTDRVLGVQMYSNTYPTNVVVINGGNYSDEFKSTFKHELGHSLGLAHSGLISCRQDGMYVSFSSSANCLFNEDWNGSDGTPAEIEEKTKLEYGDMTDIMGNSSQVMHFSGAKKNQLGMYASRDIYSATLGNPAPQIIKLSSANSEAAGTKLIRIPLKDGVSNAIREFHIEYRSGGVKNWDTYSTTLNSELYNKLYIRGIATQQRNPNLAAKAGLLNLGIYNELSTVNELDTNKMGLEVGKNYVDLLNGFRVRFLSVTDNTASVEITTKLNCVRTAGDFSIDNTELLYNFEVGLPSFTVKAKTGNGNSDCPAPKFYVKDITNNESVSQGNPLLFSFTSGSRTTITPNGSILLTGEFNKETTHPLQIYPRTVINEKLDAGETVTRLLKIGFLDYPDSAKTFSISIKKSDIAPKISYVGNGSYSFCTPWVDERCKTLAPGSLVGVYGTSLYDKPEKQEVSEGALPEIIDGVKAYITPGASCNFARVQFDSSFKPLPIKYVSANYASIQIPFGLSSGYGTYCLRMENKGILSNGYLLSIAPQAAVGINAVMKGTGNLIDFYSVGLGNFNDSSSNPAPYLGKPGPVDGTWKIPSPPTIKICKADQNTGVCNMSEPLVSLRVNSSYKSTYPGVDISQAVYPYALPQTIYDTVTYRMMYEGTGGNLGPASSFVVYCPAVCFQYKPVYTSPVNGQTIRSKLRVASRNGFGLVNRTSKRASVTQSESLASVKYIFRNLDTKSVITLPGTINEIDEVDISSLSSGNYMFEIVYTYSNGQKNIPIVSDPVTVRVDNKGITQVPSSPIISSESIISAASFTGPLVGGQIAALFGQKLKGACQSGEDGIVKTLPLPTKLCGTEIKFKKSAIDQWQNAEFIFLTDQQTNIVLPKQLAGFTGQAFMQACTSTGGCSPETSVRFAAYAPGIFTTTSDGKGQASAQTFVSGAGSTYSLLDNATTPVSPCGLIVLYLTGVGTGNSSVTKVHVNNKELTKNDTCGADPIAYIGPQGSLAGLDQINLFVPSTLLEGNNTLKICSSTQDCSTGQTVNFKATLNTGNLTLALSKPVSFQQVPTKLQSTAPAPSAQVRQLPSPAAVTITRVLPTKLPKPVFYMDFNNNLTESISGLSTQITPKDSKVSYSTYAKNDPTGALCGINLTASCGQYLNLNGTSNALSVTGFKLPTKDFTISMKFYPVTENKKNWSSLLNQSSSTNRPDGIGVYLDTDSDNNSKTGTLCVYLAPFRSDFLACTPRNSVSMNTIWQRFTVTYSQQTKTLTLYVNGVLKVTRVLGYNPNISSTKPLRIGASQGNTDTVFQDYFGGSIDELSVYDSVLPSSQIANFK